MVRVLVTVEPKMYREAIALAIQHHRPETEVLLGAEAALDGQGLEAGGAAGVADRDPYSPYAPEGHSPNFVLRGFCEVRARVCEEKARRNPCLR